MPDFTNIKIDNNTYNVADSAARANISSLNSRVDKLENSVPLSPEMFGAVGDGMTDDTEAFNNMFAANAGFYVCGENKSYKIAGNVQCNGDCVFNLNGSTLYLTEHAFQGSAFLNFQFNASTVIIYNGIVDGNGTDQWNTSIGDMVGCYAFNITASVVSVHNMAFQNIWGYALRILNAGNVSVSNSQFNNVGGHYMTNNEYDMFGDSIYIGNASSAQTVNVKSCKLYGKHSGSSLSRAGITLEGGNQTVNLAVENTIIENYDRTLHAEGVGEVKASVISCIINNTNVLAFWWKNGTSEGGSSKLLFENCSIYTTGNDYSGTRGIRGFRLITFSNCDINYAGCLIYSASLSQYDLVNLSNCSVIATKRGNASVCPLIEAGGASYQVVISNTWYEPTTNALGTFVPSGAKVVQIGGYVVLGSAGWTGSIPSYYLVAGTLTGVTDYHSATFS